MSQNAILPKKNREIKITAKFSCNKVPHLHHLVFSKLEKLLKVVYVFVLV